MNFSSVSGSIPPKHQVAHIALPFVCLGSGTYTMRFIVLELVLIMFNKMGRGCMFH